MTKRLLLTCALFAAALYPASSLADAPATPAPEWKNLQILPKNIPKEQLKLLMKGMSKSLGVDCDFCHDMPAAEKDTEHKKAAREMMKMTAEMNEKFFKDTKDKVACATCHRGKEKPEVTMRTILEGKPGKPEGKGK